jgi:hypothetical protein
VAAFRVMRTGTQINLYCVEITPQLTIIKFLVEIHLLNSNVSIRVKYNFKKSVKYSSVIDVGRGHVMNYDPVIKLIRIYM